MVSGCRALGFFCWPGLVLKYDICCRFVWRALKIHCEMMETICSKVKVCRLPLSWFRFRPADHFDVVDALSRPNGFEAKPKVIHLGPKNQQLEMNLPAGGVFWSYTNNAGWVLSKVQTDWILKNFEDGCGSWVCSHFNEALQHTFSGKTAKVKAHSESNVMPAFHLHLAVFANASDMQRLLKFNVNLSRYVIQA